eukprot:CAMPEP_0184324716 /NCGR_PEP_ID=MMETSP1049-20130417/136592_1 /TAXON_ID=77928 /ORGANISM="Proteomonas sulcata, Strain CCMP704" /LENGTH=78 /DNA_ID=CAMNT_0026646563 /DNA_START=126 /DNA_END=360 /DNA_ORIENTATION=-
MTFLLDFLLNSAFQWLKLCLLRFKFQTISTQIRSLASLPLARFSREAWPFSVLVHAAKAETAVPQRPLKLSVPQPRSP